MITAAIHGFLLAFPLIMPLGAQNIFVFNQGALHRHFVNVLPVVLTAAICDTILISLSVMGISVLVFGSVIIKSVLIGIGVVFLIYMGWTTWKSKIDNNEQNTYSSFSPTKQIIFAASVSLFNPHAIMDTVGVIGTSSLAYQGLDKFAFASATVLVSWIWFFGLAVAGRLTGKFDKKGNFIIVINKISAFIMWGAAVYLLLSLKG
ncbi:lysine exporter protein LysE/YggA [Thermincola ferriacetica]|uniref:Lysine exporter protein LysE/YggA n=1 Tax=Thermincola ferriacetica TaxID=281456 RepID=A0A0L6VZV1_9FIRM|nr:LysE/ArgO family amino acid transporter [Thermincola ferriacetica]KNZ68364.1 lysine exporter protein LysE/YggA [Thermincola ferriacetica]